VPRFIGITLVFLNSRMILNPLKENWSLNLSFNKNKENVVYKHFLNEIYNCFYFYGEETWVWIVKRHGLPLNWARLTSVFIPHVWRHLSQEKVQSQCRVIISTLYFLVPERMWWADFTIPHKRCHKQKDLSRRQNGGWYSILNVNYVDI